MFHWFEQRPFFFAVLVFVFVAFAGIVEVIVTGKQIGRAHV